MYSGMHAKLGATEEFHRVKASKTVACNITQETEEESNCEALHATISLTCNQSRRGTVPSQSHFTRLTLLTAD